MAHWSIADLAGRADIDPLAIQQFEAGDNPGIGARLLTTFRVHGLEIDPVWRTWRIEGFPFNPNPGPHIGEAFRTMCLMGSGTMPKREDLTWPPPT